MPYIVCPKSHISFVIAACWKGASSGQINHSLDTCWKQSFGYFSYGFICCLTSIPHIQPVTKGQRYSASNAYPCTSMVWDT
uniref:Uncharacterized protein n=1 Tax=Gossypium raimondii TaxID=29730 RepID=A0A0D2S1Y5_GOSRA|nr:hypothetical protein B456_012G123300 [Gossypium raimondii]